MSTKATQNTSAMDCRKELSELIKRKAEISVKNQNKNKIKKQTECFHLLLGGS